MAVLLRRIRRALLRPPRQMPGELVASTRSAWALMKAAGVMTALIGIGGTNLALADPLTPFRYEAQAQRHCPGDVVVWLDFRKEIYYAKQQRHYARGSSGSFVCRDEARAGRYRRSLLGLR